MTPGFAERTHGPAHVGIAGRVATTRAPYWASDYPASTEIVHHPGIDRSIEAAEAAHEALTRVVLAGGDVGAVADLVVDFSSRSTCMIWSSGSSRSTDVPAVAEARSAEA